jgi:hypothetical protein
VITYFTCFFFLNLHRTKNIIIIEEAGEYRQSTAERTEEDLAMEAAMKQQDMRRARHNNILDDPVDK